MGQDLPLWTLSPDRRLGKLSKSKFEVSEIDSHSGAILRETSWKILKPVFVTANVCSFHIPFLLPVFLQKKTQDLVQRLAERLRSFLQVDGCLAALGSDDVWRPAARKHHAQRRALGRSCFFWWRYGYRGMMSVAHLKTNKEEETTTTRTTTKTKTTELQWIERKIGVAWSKEIGHHCLWECPAVGGGASVPPNPKLGGSCRVCNVVCKGN